MRSGLCFVVFVVGVFCGSAFAYDWSANPGNGSEESPFQVSTPEQLLAVPQGGNHAEFFYVLTNDIVFDPNNPNHRLSSGLPELRSNFDGAGFTIRNLTIAATGTQTNVGLFTSISYSAKVRNLNVKNASVIVGGSAENAGILCGFNQGQIINCNVEGTLAGSITNAGGICGRLNGSFGGAISYCVADVTITIVSPGRKGGICGLAEQWARIHRCRAICRIVGGYNGGGICGEATESNITFCEAQLHFTADRSTGGIGGICGSFKGGFYSEIYGCSAVVDIVSQYRLSTTGGLCGFASGGSIAHSSATGTIYGRDVYRIGGLIGHNAAPVSDCYARVDIEVNDTRPTDPISTSIGGFIGWNEDRAITNAYAAGAITLNFTPQFYSNIGGFWGGGYVTLTDCFWDMEKSGLSSGAGGGTPPGLAGKTTAQMQTLATYQDAGWDFEDEPIWAIEAASYPHLKFKRFAGGSGWPDDPFLLSSPEQLIELGQSPRHYDDAFALKNDMDLAEYVFTQSVIAPGQSQNPSYFTGTLFSGILDGRGHTIRNLTIEYSGTAAECVGLFGGLAGTVRNLSIEDAIINCPDTTGFTGGLCGFSSGSIERCRAAATIIAKRGAGGLCGVSSGRVTHSYFKGQITAQYAGGISGFHQWGLIDQCYAACTFVDVESAYGGLTGTLWQFGQLRNSAWDSQLSGAAQGYGAILPDFYGFIDNIKAMTTAETKTAESFRDIGWSFVGDANGNQAWRMCTDGVETPRLSWEFARAGDFACPDGVDLADLLALTDNWLSMEAISPMLFNSACDANVDGQINLDDFSVLSENWQKNSE